MEKEKPPSKEPWEDLVHPNEAKRIKSLLLKIPTEEDAQKAQQKIDEVKARHAFYHTPLIQADFFDQLGLSEPDYASVIDDSDIPSFIGRVSPIINGSETKIWEQTEFILKHPSSDDESFMAVFDRISNDINFRSRFFPKTFYDRLISAEAKYKQKRPKKSGWGRYKNMGREEYSQHAQEIINRKKIDEINRALEDARLQDSQEENEI